MQPQSPYVSPPPQPSVPPPQAPQSNQPDYSFLNEQPKKAVSLPFVGNSFAGRILLVGVGIILLLVIFIVIKGILTTKPINTADYYLIAERQNQMLHILTTDVTASNTGQLSAAQQNFVATATLSLKTAENANISYLALYKYKVNATNLQRVFNSNIDSQFSSAATANNLPGFFSTEMQSQLNYYQQEIRAAYATTHVAGGQRLLISEYNESKLLVKALSAT